MELQNKKLSNDVFFAEQKEILNQWPTGAAVNFEDAIKFHQELPEHKNFGKKLLKAKAEGKTLVQPRAGVALVKDHSGWRCLISIPIACARWVLPKPESPKI